VEGDRTRGVGAEEGFAGLLGRRHGEEGEQAQEGEAVAAAQGHHLACPRFGEGFGLSEEVWVISIDRASEWTPTRRRKKLPQHTCLQLRATTHV
jgi:hypothetical protein